MAFEIKKPDTAFENDPKPSRARKRIKDEAHLAFIRKLPSVVSGKWPVEACHIRMGSPMFKKPRAGIGQKSDDAWTLPLTPEEHRDQHAHHESKWWLSWHIEPFTVAMALYEITGDLEAGRELIRELNEAVEKSGGQDTFALKPKKRPSVMAK